MHDDDVPGQAAVDKTVDTTQFPGFSLNYTSDLLEPTRNVEKVSCCFTTDLFLAYISLKIVINYDKMAKRVNVKQLQQTIWTDLTTSGKENTFKPQPESMSSMSSMSSAKSFAQVVSGNEIVVAFIRPNWHVLLTLIQ